MRMQQVIPGLYRIWDVDVNEHFFANDLDEVMTGEFLYNSIKIHFEQQRPRLTMLESYYKGLNVKILGDNRRIGDYTDDKADYRASHNFAKQISRFISGYMAGVPITMTHTDEDTQESINIFNEENEADALNSALALDLSIFGRAYEIMYNADNKNKIAKLDVMNTFVIYDYSVARKPIAAIRYFSDYDNKKDVITTRLTLYTATHIHEMELDGEKIISHDSQPHAFKQVPIVEYSNDEYRQGDFENVISLIDLYDAAQSDTANYMKDTNDAVMVIIGGADLTGDDAIKWRKANMVHIQPQETMSGEGKADAKYIYKQYDVGGMEAYKKRLERDIYKFTNTPNMYDETFGRAESGVALSLKLTGLAQDRAIKERLFKAGLKERYRMHFAVDNLVKSKASDAERIKFRFTANLPRDLRSDLAAFQAAGGRLSQQTLLSLFDFGTDAASEIEKIEKELEREADILSQASSYNEFES